MAAVKPLTPCLHGNTAFVLLCCPLLGKLQDSVLCEHGYFEGRMEGVRKCCFKENLMHKYSIWIIWQSCIRASFLPMPFNKHKNHISPNVI